MKFFITSSSTGVGKTLLTAALCYQLASRGDTVHPFKPIISGFSETDPDSDTRILLRSAGLKESHENMDIVSPFRFATPLSPHIAAKMEGRRIDFLRLTKLCQQKSAIKGYTLIEGAGGIMSPLTETHTFLDLISALDMPCMLVVGSYLGAISHALTAFEALKSKAEVHAIVVSESAESPMDAKLTAESIQSFTKAKTILLPRFNNTNDKWKQSPPILDALGI